MLLRSRKGEASDSEAFAILENSRRIFCGTGDGRDATYEIPFSLVHETRGCKTAGRCAAAYCHDGNNRREIVGFISLSLSLFLSFCTCIEERLILYVMCLEHLRNLSSSILRQT